MAITGNTQLGPSKQDIIIAAVQAEIKYQAKLLPYVTDFSAFTGKGMKSVAVPKLTSFTATNRTSGSAGVPAVLTASSDTIDLDQRAYVSWLVDATDEMQSTLAVQLEFAKRAATAHGRYVDDYIITILEASAGYNQGVLTAVTRDALLDMREYLLGTGKCMRENLALAVGTDNEKAMLKIDEFTRADAYGSSNIPAGVIGQVFGIPVIVHAGLAAGKVYMWDKNGVGIAFQKAATMESQTAIDYGTGAKLVAMDQLFGAEALQQGEAGTVAPATPYIAKL